MGVLFLNLYFDRFWCHIVNDIKIVLNPLLVMYLMWVFKSSIVVSYLVSFIGAAKIVFVVQSYRMKMVMYPSMRLLGIWSYFLLLLTAFHILQLNVGGILTRSSCLIWSCSVTALWP